MAEVKGKVKLVQTNLGDFNVEAISGSPFYNRYSEFQRVFQKHLSSLNPDFLFAQPELNVPKGALDWYVPQEVHTSLTLHALKNTEPQDYARYSALKQDIIRQLVAITAGIDSSSEKERMECAIKFLDCDYADKITYCHDQGITFAVWGMKLRHGRDINTVITDDARDHRVYDITYVLEGQGAFGGNESIKRKHGYVLQGPRDIPEVKPAPHHSFVEWRPEAPHGKVVESDVIYTAVCKRTDDFIITFFTNEGGTFDGECVVEVAPGTCLAASAVPEPRAEEGYSFSHWSPAVNTDTPVNNDVKYEAVFEKIAIVPPTGLDESQEESNESQTETENTEETPVAPVPIPLPWYKRFWLWLESLFAGKGCLRWLLTLLLLLLFLWLLIFLCKDCTNPFSRGPVNGVSPLDSITRSDGTIVDDNGHVHPVTGDDGELPSDSVIAAPVMGEGGDEPPIISQPGVPDIIANRLFLFMENDNGDLDGLARDFKAAYPGEKYSIIGFDREVKMLVIQVPENERSNIRQNINSKLSKHSFIVFDEEVYELNGQVSQTPSDLGWHLKAAHVKEGWNYTPGSPDVKVAIVDDGIQPDHPMFRGRIVAPYNVFTRNNALSLGDGHGTHTAALAAGSCEYLEKGAAGVAPGCKLMPVQVFDNKMCPLSALVAGVMYAIHHDADVVNISIGPSFQGLNVLPVDQQDVIARTQFLNVAALWAKVCKLAAQKRCILVFAAGNDNILTSIPPENRNESSLVVAAVDSHLRQTNFTNYGPCSDISAPGSAIYSAFPRNSFQSCDGTSMAAPIVTGAVALMKSLKKDLTVEQARNVLFSTGADVYGWVPPMVLVDKALDAVKRGDFSRRERIVRPIPDVDSPSFGRVPDDGRFDGPPPTRRTDPVSDNPRPDVSPSNPQPTPAKGNGDYDEIRRMIREHEEAIRKLKEKLPPGER